MYVCISSSCNWLVLIDNGCGSGLVMVVVIVADVESYCMLEIISYVHTRCDKLLTYLYYILLSPMSYTSFVMNIA